MTLREAGIRLTLAGQAEYRAGIRTISQEMRTMSNESKLAVAQLGANASITETYSTRMKSMGAEIETAGKKAELFRSQQDKLSKVMTELPDRVKSLDNAWKDSQKETERLEQNYKQMSKALGENHTETIKAKQAYEKSKVTTANLKTEYTELSKELTRTEKELAKLPNELAKAELATQKLRNEAEKLHTEYRNAGGRYADIAKGWQEVGEQITTTGEAMSKAGNWMTTRFTVPIVAGFGAAIKTGLTFDAQMRETAAIAGLTANDLTIAGGAYEQLREQAIQLGADSIFGATDVAKAQEMMASAGFEVVEILGAIPGVMDLAAVSGKDMGLASQAVATAMNQFGLEASESTRVADVFARAAADTNAETYDMAEALKYAGNVLGPMGIQFEEAAAAIGIMSNAGVSGSMAGTALRGAFTRLANPTKQVTSAMLDLGWSAYDSEGNMKSLSEMIPELRDSLSGLTNEQRDQYLASIFGTNALSGMLALVNAAPGELEALVASLENSSGAAQQMAEVINSGANGAIEELSGAIETLSIELFDTLAPSLISVVEGITDAVESFSDLDESTQLAIVRGALFVAAAGPIISTLGSITTGTGKVVTGVGDMIKWFGKVTTPKTLTDIDGTLTTIPTSATLAGKSATFFSNPWVTAGTIAIASIAGFVMYMNNEANKPFEAHNESVKETDGAYQSWFDSILAGQTTIEAMNKSARDEATATTEVYKALADELRGSNLDTQNFVNETMRSDKPWIGSPSYVRDVGGQDYAFVVEPIGVMLEEYRKAGLVIDSEIESINDAVQDHAIMLTNSFVQLANATLAGNVITSEWASVNIDAVKSVANETVARLSEMKQAKLDELNAQLANNTISKADYDERVQAINSAYNQEVAIVEQSQANIQSILSNASRDKRQLTENEVVALLKNYQDLATATGQSMSEVEGLGELIGNNLSALLSHAGLEFLSLSGILSDEDLLNIAGAQTAEEQINILTEALKEYGFTNVDPKDFPLDADGAINTIMTLEELLSSWNDLTVAEKTAQIEGRGADELQVLLETLGVDWNSLTVAQQTAIANTSGKEQVEETLYVLGEWQNLTLQEKRAILETQIDSKPILALIGQRELWNNEEFVSQFANVDTNSENAIDEMSQVISTWTKIPLNQVKQLLTDTNANATAVLVEEYNLVAGATPGKVSSTVDVSVGGIVGSTANVSSYTSTVEKMPTSKSSEVSTNIFSMVLNTLAVAAYNTATGKMKNTTATASTNIPNMTTNTSRVNSWNTSTGSMRNKTSTATTKIPNMISYTSAVRSWNTAVSSSRDKSSSLKTSVPNISTNTNSVWNWISALNNAYNRTSTLTTRRVTAYSTTGIAPRGYKDGGHIDAYADGGNIKWGGLFANGGQVPRGYMGIVGEAGPELFHVTDKGVSITPLSSNEKMRGVEGAIEDYLGKHVGASVEIKLEINHPVIREENDLDKLASAIKDKLAQSTKLENLFSKGRTA